MIELLLAYGADPRCDDRGGLSVIERLQQSMLERDEEDDEIIEIMQLLQSAPPPSGALTKAVSSRA
jgi:hypothetical protein